MYYFRNRHTGSRIALRHVPGPTSPEVLWVPVAGRAGCGEPLDAFAVGFGVPDRDGFVGFSHADLSEHWTACAPFDLLAEHGKHCSECREHGTDHQHAA